MQRGLGPKVDAIIQRGACFTPPTSKLEEVRFSGRSCSRRRESSGSSPRQLPPSGWLLNATATSFAWLPRFLELGYSVQNRGLRWCIQHVGDVMYVPPLATHLGVDLPSASRRTWGPPSCLGGLITWSATLAGVHGRKFARTMRSMFPCGVRRTTRLTNARSLTT